MLSVADFVNAAGMPTAWKEEHLQTYLAECLEKQGFQACREVGSNGGFADIVSDFEDGSIIEVKKYLDRNTIYQAAGQLHLYGLGNTRRLVVMGFMTPEASKQVGALNTAKMIEQDPRYSVIFVNMQSKWYPNAASGNSKSVQFRLPEWSFNFDWFNWLKNPPPTHKAIFNVVALLFKVATSHPLPTFLVCVALFAIATTPPQKENPPAQKVMVRSK